MIDPSAFIAPGAVVVGAVSIGRDSSVWYNAVLRGDTDTITVGDETNIQDLAVLHADAGVPCTVGSRVGIGHRAIVHGCTVEDGCLVGMGAILMNGVRVGQGSVIGAGAVLLEQMTVPPGSVVVGVPARILGPVTDEHRARLARNWSHYVEEARRHRTGRYPRHGSTGG